MTTRIAIVTLIACLALVPFQSAQASILAAGWYDFGAGNNNFESLTSTGKLPDITLAGVSGDVRGGDGSRGGWSSTDGFFGNSSISTGTGDTASAATPSANGAMASRTGNGGERVDIRISNNTGSDLPLLSLLLDVSSLNRTDTPDVFTVLYKDGDLAVPDGTQISQVIGIASATVGDFADYLDYSFDLTSLADYTLADGESATFRLVVSDADNAGAPLAYDNIAFTTIPEPASIILVGLGGLAMAKRRR